MTRRKYLYVFIVIKSLCKTHYRLAIELHSHASIRFLNKDAILSFDNLIHLYIAIKHRLSDVFLNTKENLFLSLK